MEPQGLLGKVVFDLGIERSKRFLSEKKGKKNVLEVEAPPEQDIEQDKRSRPRARLLGNEDSSLFCPEVLR